MYEYINGRLDEITPTEAIVEAGGIGYKLLISLSTFSALQNSKDQLVKIFLHHQVREDDESLYGFATRDERHVFTHLVSVSGVGPGSARMILSSMNPEEVRTAILGNDVNRFKAVKGMLGTTFGGNYLAMAAALSVLDIMEKENLVENALKVGEYIKANIPASPKIKEVRGQGLMLGIEFNEEVAPIRKELLFNRHIFTGVAGKNMVRLLAPLCLTKAQADVFINAINDILK